MTLMQIQKPNILIVDDDVLVLKAQKRRFSNAYDVKTTDNIKNAKLLLKENDYAAAIIDMHFPEDERGGLKLCEYIKQNNIKTIPIVLTAFSSLEVAKELINNSTIFALLDKDQDENNLLVQKLEEAVKLYQHDKLTTQLLKQFYTNNSAHTFENKYLTPLNNLCYLLHKNIEPYNDSARNIIFIIENFLNLWGNEYSVKKSVPFEDFDKYNGLKWIDIFSWQGFEQDIKLFSDYFLQFQFESITDHYETQFNLRKLKQTNIYDLVEINYTQRDRDLFLMGIRPIFREILVSLIQNAIEAMPLFTILKQQEDAPYDFEKSIIDIEFNQDENETHLRVTNDTIPFDKESLETINELISHLRKISNIEISRTNKDLLNNILEKRFTTKSGIGNGGGLIEAAFYFTNIVHVQYNPETKELMERKHGNLQMKHEDNKMTIEITMPFGTKLVNKFLQSKNGFQTADERVVFNWSELYGG